MNNGWTYIYGLTDPETGEVRYIGKSDHPKRRRREHINESKRADEENMDRKDEWITGLLDKGLKPGVIVLAATLDEYWRRAEPEIMDQYKDNDLLNAAPGGAGPPNWQILIEQAWARPERHKKLSEHNRRRWADPKYKERVSAAISETQSKPEVKLRMSEAQKRAWANSPQERYQQRIDMNNEMWADPEYRQFMVDIQEEIWSDQERLEVHAERTRQMWQDPEYREKVITASTSPEVLEARSQAAKEMWSDPEFKERRTEQIREMWQNPDFRERHAESMDAVRGQISESLREYYTDPENRRRVSEWATERMKDQELRERISESVSELWNDPEYREKQHRARNRGKLRPDVEKAAEALGVKVVTIYKYCHQGKLGKKIDGSWVITDEDIEAYRDSQG